MTNQEKLGKLGEQLVANMEEATLSEYKYDSEKDMIQSDGTTIEVKTQNRHPNGCFTVNAMHVTNLNKCLKVDRLIFVEYDSSEYIKVYECTDRKYKLVNTRPTKREPEGRIMVCWPIDKMKLLKTISNSELATEMRNLSNSRLYNKDSQYSIGNK
jgi:hypothetical protein